MKPGLLLDKKEYGRLYTWTAAMGLPESCNKKNCKSQIKQQHQEICPNGFHVPTEKEFEEQLTFVGGTEIAAVKLKSITEWKENYYSNDQYGFSITYIVFRKFL